jgi:hypothetical protein
MKNPDPSIDLLGRLICEMGRVKLSDHDVLTAITAAAAYACLSMNDFDEKRTIDFIKKGMTKSTISAIPAVLSLMSVADQLEAILATKQ